MYSFCTDHRSSSFWFFSVPRFSCQSLTPNFFVESSRSDGEMNNVLCLLGVPAHDVLNILISHCSMLYATLLDVQEKDVWVESFGRFGMVSQSYAMHLDPCDQTKWACANILQFTLLQLSS